MKIELQNVNYIYNKGLASQAQAVKDVNLTIEDGSSFIALIGSTGSGKSTMIQMFNGLLQPTGGRILYDGVELFGDTTKLSAGKAGKKQSRRAKKAQQQAAALNRKQVLRELRKKVGLVFQYPENQFFDETVVLDTAFGPKNQGFTQEEAIEKAKAALRTVGVPEELFEKSPFELSGGEMRRVAIAGVLVMEPEVLVLDEPTAGLDPQGKIEILDCIKRLQKNEAACSSGEKTADPEGTLAADKQLTVIFVSHNMEEVAMYADRVIAMSQGQIVFDGSPKEAFARHEELEMIGLKAPEVTYICEELGISGVTTTEEAADALLQTYLQDV